MAKILAAGLRFCCQGCNQQFHESRFVRRPRCPYCDSENVTLNKAAALPLRRQGAGQDAGF